MGMRYAFQLVVMWGDLLIMSAAAYLIYLYYFNPFSWLAVIFAFRVWYRQGGFLAWKPENIKKFLRNAKEIGL